MPLTQEHWTVLTWTVYLVIGTSVTIWVARALRLHAPRFFPNNNPDDDLLTESITRLILVGFYLVNFGAISLAVKYGDQVTSAVSAVEILSTKVGIVLLAQGFVHFVILAKLFVMRGPDGRHSVPPTDVPRPTSYGEIAERIKR